MDRRIQGDPSEAGRACGSSSMEVYTERIYGKQTSCDVPKLTRFTGSIYLIPVMESRQKKIPGGRTGDCQSPGFLVE